MNKQLISAFWACVAVTTVDACWLWIGPTRREYGRFYKGKIDCPAHRFSWIIAFGDPGKLLVCHKCDIPLCVNPKHLFIGTNKDNSEDMVAKGRWRGGQGESSYLSKLNDQAVLTLRKRYDSGETKLITYWADQYGVTRGAILQAVERKTWRHLP